MSSGPDHDPLPPRPGRAAAAAGGRPERTRLSREGILDVAMRVLDAEGLDAVTMRRIATELGTGPASLYAHVANKDELLDGLVERVAATVRFPAPDPDRWQDQVKEVVRGIHTALSAHRDLAGVNFARIPLDEGALAVSEGLLAIMLAGGVPPRDAALASDTLPLYAVVHAYEGGLWLQRFGDEEQAQAFFAELHAYFAALPPSRFPLMSSMADLLVNEEDTAYERFEFGLDLLVRGLAARAADAPAGASTASGTTDPR